MAISSQPSLSAAPTPKLYPLASTTWDHEEIAAIQKVVDAGTFTMGHWVREFEAAFADHFGSKHAVMVNSGSSANLLLVGALTFHSKYKLKPGDEVLVPAVSWSTTYYPVTQYGLKLRFVDVNLDTLNLDLAQLEAAITPQTKAVFAVNLLGNPLDFELLLDICNRHNLLLIEDNCESMGASFGGKKAGTFGIGGTFSTFFSHHICTMEGGVIVTDDEELMQILKSLRAHGWLRDLPAQNHVHPKTGDDFQDSFLFALPGFNVRPVEMSGAIGLPQLAKLPSFVEARRDNAKRFLELFSDLPDVRTQQETGESSWFGFSMIFEGRLRGRRAEVVEAFRAHGIDCRPIVAGNFLKNPVIQHLPHSTFGECSQADRIDRDGLFIGNHHYPLVDPLLKVREIVGEIANR